MITKLLIKNYAIIAEVEITFKKGLTIITGETGAGKSILMGALSLILGERADSQALFNKEIKCIIEGCFDIQQIESAKKYLSEKELDNGNELIIRREIAMNGKSRVFINDIPCTLNMLTPLASMLIDLHRQFDTIELQQQAEQLSILDEVCQHHILLADYKQAFKKWLEYKIAYENICKQNLQIKQELDYNQFLFDELETFQAKEDELESIEKELYLLNNSEALKTNLSAAIFRLKESDDPLLSALKGIYQLIHQHADKSTQLNEISERLQSSLIELKEISTELEDVNASTQLNQHLIEQLNERLHEGNRLLKKHHLQQTNELIELKNNLEEKILSANNADLLENELGLKIKEAFEQAQALANKLTTSRSSKINYFKDHVHANLKKVGMPNARFDIQIDKTNLSELGQDQITFLFDTNKTGQFSPISKVASGGELSRLMLCIKSLLADANALPTLIFDEIDSGISGETALQVGLIMKDLSKHHQLITITHLPQIAGKADHHLYIYKQENEEGVIHTQMKEVSGNERINILAEMLSGKQSSKQAKEMVKELMK